MASYYEDELASCLAEMERLREKMTKLKEEKKLEDQLQEEKTNKVEPNMEVMEKWIESIIGERKKAKKAKKLYESLTQYTSLKKRQEVWNLRTVYYNNKLDKWMPPEPVHLFHIQKYKEPDAPSQFMIDFIEATYNLFQIQQKRIDKLENVISEFLAKK